MIKWCSMRGPNGREVAGAPCAEATTEWERHFEDILNSRTFERAPALKSLLIYVWEHRTDAVNEYAIAVDALKKKPDFDPKFDATVRVQIARLRQKLKEHYEREGHSCSVRIMIPPGQHLPQVQLCPMPPDPVPAVGVPRRAPSRFVYLLASLTPILAVSSILLYLQATRLRSTVTAEHPAGKLPAIWRSFFLNGKSADLFIPTPVFFEWKDSHVKMRDTTVNSFNEIENSIELRPHLDRFGTPTLMENYTVTSDALAAVKLTQYLERAGRTVEVHSSAELPLELPDDKNVILLGIPKTSQHVRDLMEKTNFYYSEGTVFNRSPRPGESARYDGISLSHDRQILPGVIAVLPVRRGGLRILMLIGARTQALAVALVSPGSLKTLDETLEDNGSPPFFELVLQAEIEGSTILRVWPVALRKTDEPTFR